MTEYKITEIQLEKAKNQLLKLMLEKEYTKEEYEQAENIIDNLKNSTGKEGGDKKTEKKQ